ncbi:28765_t:CDS:2 [Gigaspora margarita]|uniref:28765_t:CDS:1 n=1 Tax=Gigaspora margarita TaxID=4874 RepID=A0ABN7V6B5_GIGMA|nr:28765_t:CDS:2 [Gigaspora margarita]
MKYGTTSHFKITDNAIGENYSLELTTQGYLYTFGSRDSYQLGRRILGRNKSNCLMLIPKKVVIRIKKIFAGGYHSFAVSDGEITYIWGQNAESQCELHHTLVLLENGDVYSFGCTRYKQLGIGASEGNQNSPVQINLDKCKYIATGDYYSIAVNNENKVYTWGFGGTYALGNRSENNELLPFELKCKEFGEISAIGGSSQYSVILSNFHN